MSSTLQNTKYGANQWHSKRSAIHQYVAFPWLVGSDRTFVEELEEAGIPTQAETLWWVKRTYFLDRMDERRRPRRGAPVA